MREFDLAEFIPPRSFADSYIQRDLGGGLKDVQMLTRAIQTKKNVLLMGPTGPGKTSLYLATCALNEWPLGTVNLNGQTTAEDLVGQIVPVPRDPSKMAQLQNVVVKARSLLARVKADELAKGKVDRSYVADQDRIMPLQEAVWKAELALEASYHDSAEFEWVDGLLIRMMKGDSRFEHTVFLADEVNFAPAKIMALLNGVTDHRRQIAVVQHVGEMVHAHPGFHFGAAMNPAYQGTKSLNEAFKDRFQIQLFFDYEPAVERELVKDPRLVDLAEKLRVMEKKDEIHTPTSTRMMMQFEENRDLFGPEFALESFISRYDESEQMPVKETAKLALRARPGAPPIQPVGQVNVP